MLYWVIMRRNKEINTMNTFIITEFVSPDFNAGVLNIRLVDQNKSARTSGWDKSCNWNISWKRVFFKNFSEEYQTELSWDTIIKLPLSWKPAVLPATPNELQSDLWAAVVWLLSSVIDLNELGVFGTVPLFDVVPTRYHRPGGSGWTPEEPGSRLGPETMRTPLVWNFSDNELSRKRGVELLGE